MVKIRMLCLGDSYTIGEGVAECDRWPELVRDTLREKLDDVEPPTIVAKTGWTSDELLGAIETRSLLGEWSVVTLMIGVNDQYRGRSVEEFQINFEKLVEVALSLAGNNADRILVISIPDWSVTPFAEGRDRARISAEIDRFNQVLGEHCNNQRIAFLDITDISRQASNDPSSWLAEDKLHPSPRMHKAWSERITPTIRKVLSMQHRHEFPRIEQE
jgi:lysophospholipase L1-like esterase